MAGNPTIPTENIDEVILGLLALQPNEIDEISYETYKQYLKELLVEVTSAKRKIPAEEFKLIKDEFNRVKGKKGRFKIKTKKTKISADNFSVGGIRKQLKGTQQRIMLMPVGGIPKDTKEKVETVSKKKKTEASDPLLRISKTLDSILKTLTDINKENKKKTDKERRESENKRRVGREKDLESGRFDGIKKAISSIIKPFQSIWDRIVNFITNIILGRIVIKLLDWFADEKNQGKIRSIIRFFGDHWPTLLALYLRFGTSLGRFVGRLGGVLIKGAFRLGAYAAKLATKAGLKKFAGAARFLGGPRGKAVATVAGIAADVAVTAGAAAGIKGFFGGNEEKTPPTQQFSGGGAVRYPKFAGGGFANFGKMFGGAAMGAGMGSMFGPMGMLLGAGIGGAAGSGMFSGTVKGQKGRDKVPAMLTDGEFVMSVGAVRKYGVDTLEAMNAAGGGTNIPQIARGITYAAGGGYVGDAVAAQEAWTNYMKMNPEQFAKGGAYGNFESVNKASRDFMRTFMKTGKPPEWAKIKQKATRVQKPDPSSKPKPNVNVNVDAKPSTSITRPSPQGTPRGGALSTDVRTPKPRVRGYGGALQAAFAAMEFNDRKQAGQTTAQAGLGAAGSALGGQVGWMAGAKGGALIGGAVGAMFGGVGAAPGAAVGAIIGGVAGGFGGASLGGKLADDLSGVNVAKERMSRGGVGGAVKGGYGLKGQSFKDAPKTMVMTDEKGRPFVGHKAMKGGKLTYVRPPKPGTGTTNPLEMLGRAINPGAYKENDQRLAMKNQKIAMVNALESFQKQGMSPDAQARMMKQMGGNLKDVQNDLNYRKKRGDLVKQGKLKPDGTPYTAREKMRMSISGSQTRRSAVKPKPKPKPKVQVAGGGMGGRRGSGSNPSRGGTKPPSFSPTHRSGTQKSQAIYGVRK